MVLKLLTLITEMKSEGLILILTANHMAIGYVLQHLPFCPLRLAQLGPASLVCLFQSTSQNRTNTLIDFHGLLGLEGLFFLYPSNFLFLSLFVCFLQPSAMSSHTWRMQYASCQRTRKILANMALPGSSLNSKYMSALPIAWAQRRLLEAGKIHEKQSRAMLIMQWQ